MRKDILRHTLDERNPAHQLLGSISHHFQIYLGFTIDSRRCKKKKRFHQQHHGFVRLVRPIQNRGVDRFTYFPLWFSWSHNLGVVLLMAEILHQLRLVVFPIIYRVSYIPGGAGFQPSTVFCGLWHCSDLEIHEMNRVYAMDQLGLGESGSPRLLCNKFDQCPDLCGIKFFQIPFPGRKKSQLDNLKNHIWNCTCQLP